MCPWQDSHLHWSGFEADVSAGWTTRALKVGAPGRIRTGTEPGLSRPPLLVGLRERKGSPHGRAERGETAALTDFKMKAAICTRTDLFLRQAPLLVGLHGEVSGAPGRNFACNLRVRSAALYILSYGSVKVFREENENAEGCLAPSRNSLLIYFSVSLLPPWTGRRTAAAAIWPGKMVGCHGIAPCSRRLRAGTSLSKFATRNEPRHEGGVEPPQPGL